VKVFFDTNVLASALATRGLCADVLRETLARHQLQTSRLVLEELRRVLRDKFRVPPALVEKNLRFLRESATLAESSGRPKPNKIDPDDAAILSAALACGSDVFVTGDQELVRLKTLGGMPILTPRAFWETVRGARRG
jgi:putative PIN family toxin of toxin-antitoxin system